MHPIVIARVLVARRRLRGRETWSSERRAAWRNERFAALRAYAYARSPFYRRFHRGLERAPLEELPVLTKDLLLTHFDEIATDPAVRLDAVSHYLANLRDDALFAGRFWVSTTSGSSGKKSVVVSAAREWAETIASYARANEWAGVLAKPTSHTRMAVVSSKAPWHQSLRVAATVQSPFVETARFDAAEPLEDIVRALDAFQPDVVIAYASMARMLAEAQLASDLHIAPRAVNVSSEVLTRDTRELVARAWGREPFEVYAATEAGGIAAECEAHRGMHLFDDRLAVENVDREIRPVAPGVTGDMLLVTVLASRTLPLIRFAMTDRVRFAGDSCSCGRTFPLIAAVEGRTDEVIVLGGHALHPLVFVHALEKLPLVAWQVVRDRAAVRVRVVGPTDGVENAVRSALARSGVNGASVVVERVAEIPAGPGGKRPLVVAKDVARAT